MKIKEVPGRTKEFISDFTRFAIGISIGIVGVVTSVVLELHAIWQLDLICVEPVWDTLKFIGYTWPYIQSKGLNRFADLYFQDGPLIKTTVGGAYDIFLGMSVFSLILMAISVSTIFLSIVYYYRYQLKELERQDRSKRNW
jgi:hypothetical protein